MSYKKGQVSAEFYVALLAFIGVLAYISFQLFQTVPASSANAREEAIRIEAYQISELLVNDGGHPLDWETRPLAEIRRIGLSDSERNITNYLSRQKVDQVRVLCDSSWKKATDNAGWVPVQGSSSVVFNNRMWVLGKRDCTNCPSIGNDVWSSDDGISWTIITKKPEWSDRYGQAALVFNNRMWVLGGQASGGIGTNNEVWSSTDGITWELAGNAQWSPRYGHSSVVFNNRMWVLSGQIVGGTSNDVWWSTNGITWTMSTNSLPFGTNFAAMTVFNNRMWVMTADDVWSSDDGIIWTQVTSNAPWVRTTSALVFDNKMWIIGEKDADSLNNDVWSSTDGATWVSVTSNIPWLSRFPVSSVVFNNRMWVLGDAGSKSEDIWFSEGHGHHKIKDLLDLNNRIETSLSIIEHKVTGDDVFVCKSTAPTNKKIAFNSSRTVSIDGTAFGEIIVEVWRQ